MLERVLFLLLTLTSEISVIILRAEAYSEPSQTSKMKIEDWKPLTIFAKNSIQDIILGLGSEDASGKTYNVPFVVILPILIKYQPYKIKLSITFHWSNSPQTCGASSIIFQNNLGQLVTKYDLLIFAHSHQRKSSNLTS